MNAAQKAEFVTSLCNSVRDAVIARIQYMPDEWDGIELRAYLARQFADENYLKRPDRKRWREFKNTVATKYGL